MTKPKYQIGDQVTIEKLPCQILKVNQTKNIGTTYLIKFLNLPAMKTLVSENEIDD